jgi:hypothetical protein
MDLLILRQTSIAGRPARVGDVVEVGDRDARLLIASGKATPAPTVQDLEPTPAPTRTRKPRTRTHGST